MNAQDKHKFTHARRKSRRLAMQALYQWQMTGQNVKDILKQFMDEQDVGGADPEYFRELLLKVSESSTSLDGLLLPFVDRNSIEEIDPVERAILRIATYELEHRPEIPYRVVINEAIELTKKFGADEAHKFVNGVLDKAVQHIRQAELAKKR